MLLSDCPIVYKSHQRKSHRYLYAMVLELFNKLNKCAKTAGARQEIHCACSLS